MLSVESRIMTAEERAQVERSARAENPPLFSLDSLSMNSCGVGGGGFCFAPLVGIPAGLLYIVLSLLRMPTTVVGWLIGTAGLGGALFSLWEMRKTLAEIGAQNRRDLAEGMVEVLHCTVSDAVGETDYEEDTGYFSTIPESSW
jgi:hypothetical protein